MLFGKGRRNLAVIVRLKYARHPKWFLLLLLAKFPEISVCNRESSAKFFLDNSAQFLLQITRSNKGILILPFDRDYRCGLDVFYSVNLNLFALGGDFALQIALWFALCFHISFVLRLLTSLRDSLNTTIVN